MSRVNPLKIRKYGASRGVLAPSANLFTPGANFNLVETGTNQIRTLAFSAKAAQTFAIVDDAGVGQYAALELCTLPEDVQILRMSCIGHLGVQFLAPVIDAPVVTASLGTAAAASGIALATDKVNVLASAAVAAGTAKLVSADLLSVTPVIVPIAGEKIYLNIRIADDALHAAGAGHQLLADDGEATSTYFILNVHMAG
jgi:hypothetical protein